MIAKAKINITSVVGIREAIEQIFVLIRKHIDAYAQNTEDRMQIESCQYYVHQLNGMLEMLELEGVLFVSQKMEGLIEALLQEKVESPSQTRVVLKQATRAIYRYLDALIDGISDNPATLLPIYRKLMQVQGIKEISESDLFFPDLRQDLPLPKTIPEGDPSQKLSTVKKVRSEFQTGLLKWLKDTSNKEGLKQMFDAVNLAEQIPAPIEQRTFWWLSSGFLDGLIHQDESIDLSTRRLCGKIEQEIRHFDKDAHVVANQLMREILYRVARSSSNSERIKEIENVFDWRASLSSFDQLANAVAGPDEDSIQPILDAMHEILLGANDQWREYSAGNQESLEVLMTAIDKLKQLAPQVNCAPLEKLISVMSGAVAFLRIRPQNMGDRLAIDLASSLLIVENAIENFFQLSPEFPDQVEALAARIRADTSRKDDEIVLPDLPGPDETGYQVQEKKLFKQIAQESLISLAQIEDILDRFFYDPSIRVDLPVLPDLFKQIAGVFSMLELDRANVLLTLCRDLVTKLLDPEYQISQTEQTLLADGLSSLSFYIEALKNSQFDRDQIVESAINLFGQSIVPNIEVPNIAEQVTFELVEPQSSAGLEPVTVVMAQTGDSELLAVFLEESDDVLSSIAEKLSACRSNPADLEALAAIRRGFHTLKGSGRMVKLYDLSEAAWRIEQVMNRWLSERNPATEELLDLLECGRTTIGIWCDSLKKIGTAEIDPTELFELARRLMYASGPEKGGIGEIETEVRRDVATEQIEPLPLATEVQTSIAVGNIKIPHDLFFVFTSEAGKHAETLNAELSDLTENPNAPIKHEFMLAAHTLSSISRTLGLTYIADIGVILEQYLTQLLRKSGRPDESALALVKETVSILDSMVSSVRNQQQPSDENIETGKRLSSELSTLLEKLQAEETEVADIHYEQDLVDQAISTEQRAFVSSGLRDVSISDQDKIDLELLEVFIEEAHELLPEIGRNLRLWRAKFEDYSAREGLLRALHTLKGSARIAGAMALGELLHQMENTVEQTSRENLSVTLFDRLEAEFDEINDHIEQLQRSHTAEAQFAPSIIPVTTTAEVPAQSAIRSFNEHVIEAPQSEPIDSEFTTAKTVLRVDSALIDRLVNESGEASIMRSRVDAELYGFKQSLQDLDESTERMRGQLREIEIMAETRMPSGVITASDNQSAFDPLELDRFTRFQELTRLMAESLDDIVTVHKSLREIHRVTLDAVGQQARLNSQVQHELIHLRTVPFKHYSEHFYRVVRQVSRDVGKRVNLTIHGDEIEIDRSVLDKINSPLEHLLRNAIVHGIESTDKRLQLGKPEEGQITIDLSRDGNEIILILHDDGAGLDFALIREKAKQLGIADEDTITDEQVKSVLFTHGFTTLQAVNEVAGRGVGLDVVKNEITDLGGQIEVTSTLNQGTSFTLRLPITLALAQAVLVKVGEHTYAVPSAQVVHILELNNEGLAAAYQQQSINFQGHCYSLAYLPNLLNITNQSPEIKRHNRILLLQNGDLFLAVHVDTLIGNCEIVVKNSGLQLSQVPGVEGATILGDGSIVLIVNLIKIFQRKGEQALILDSPLERFDLNKQIEKPKLPIVMVVDDSLTVRKVTSRLLEREGYEVIIAKDGVGALQILQEILPSIMLVDIEMPHMDGFELIRAVRNNVEMSKIPIIIISSRTAEKHRKLAAELGVHVFLGKPYQEEELLEHIIKLIHK
ncbi:MAG TPA: Hpt domain-containing protein [Nitrosomonas sp.]|nr:Hpt domain-containing protein [Nitrosomonas sp.]HNO19134.1 Hpt domain-containing protein [Nitrosomonas sp.]